MYQTIFFDLDGTLLNTIDDLAAAGNYALHRLGFAALPPENYKLLVGDGIPKLVERIFPTGSLDEREFNKALDLFQSYYGDHFCERTVPYPGIPELLAALQQCDIQLAVISNKADVYTQELIRHYFPDIFNFILGKVQAFPSKPAPDSLLYATRMLSVSPSACLYCGDSSNDINFAKNAGISSCGVTWGFRSRLELVEAGADYITDDPASFLQLIIAE